MNDKILVALQRGLPLCAKPFEALANDVGCTEADVLAVLADARKQGIVRRFGAVFDTRRLGYKSALCAVAVPREQLDDVAARITPLTGITHCYVREAGTGNSSIVSGQSSIVSGVRGAPPSSRDLSVANHQTPNLWFTLSYPADIFPSMADEVAARIAPHEMHVLPATRRYKVDVVFGAATRVREECVSDDELSPVTARERAVIGAVQGDTEVRSDYFAAIAEKLGMKEWDVLSLLDLWLRNGRLKRIALLLRHRNAGWTANGMCCWRIEGDTAAVGRALADCGEVTHCYERPTAPNFPYNMFAMIHAHTLDEAAAQFDKLSSVVDSVTSSSIPSVMLISTHEYKKTSMSFFNSAADI